MTLSTHIVVGAALASVYAGGPATAFGVGLLSHYLLDSIAHWDYPIAYLEKGATTTRTQKLIFLAGDVSKVTIDAGIGILILLIIFSSERFFTDSRIIMAIIGSAFPDFLQFVLIFYKHKILAVLQKFHHSFHSAGSLNDAPIRGILAQVCIIGFFVLAMIK